MLKILALDTSGELCSTALLVGDEIIQREQLVPRRHADVILDMLDELLSAAEVDASQLDAIAFGRGPGSFTGVRIAAAVTQGVAYSLDKPVIAVSTLAALAQGLLDSGDDQQILTAVDARMNEVYWAGYARNADGYAAMRIKETVVPPAAVPIPENGKWTAAGNGWQAYASELKPVIDTHITEVHSDTYLHATSIARLGAYYFNQGLLMSAEQAIPVYLRDKVAEKSRA